MKLIRLTIVSLVLAAAIIAGVTIAQRQMDKRAVTNFDSCAAAGNPIQESYPAVCHTPDGQAFIQPTP